MKDKNHKNESRSQALNQALLQIEKQFGQGIIMSLNDNYSSDVEVMSTGSLTIDIALGIGGIPRGRIIEIFGPESSGKTTITLHIISEVQKSSGTCVFIDAEHALDIKYAVNLGVNLDTLLISQPNSGEQALDIVDNLAKSGAVDLIVVDSVAALTPRAEIEGNMGDQLPGLQARLMSQALRKLTSGVKNSNCAIIFINQLRMKIGTIFGNPETTSGGNALKFYSSVRMDVRRSTLIKKEERVVGNEVRVRIVKNKVAAPFKEAHFEMMYGSGISRESELINIGIHENIISRSGSWYYYEQEKIGQGKDNVREFLKQNQTVANKIESEIRKKTINQ